MINVRRPSTSSRSREKRCSPGHIQHSKRHIPYSSLQEVQHSGKFTIPEDIRGVKPLYTHDNITCPVHRQPYRESHPLLPDGSTWEQAAALWSREGGDRPS